MKIKAVLIMPGPNGTEVMGDMMELSWEGEFDMACAMLGALRWERLPDDLNLALPIAGWDDHPRGPLPGNPQYVAPGDAE